MEEETIESLLHRLGFDEQVEEFEEQDIDLKMLLESNETELKSILQAMNLTVGKQVKITREIADMKSRSNVVMEREGRHDGDTCEGTDQLKRILSWMTPKNLITAKSSRPWKEEEIRIVLIGKTGCGKSATGNTILGRKHFESSVSASSVTSKCSQTSAVRFNQKILIVDTPGIFDTTKKNKNIQKEILKCLAITSPGPHAFILVLNIARYTEEEEKSVQHFVDSFGEKIFQYFIVLFTRKDDLDEEGKTLDDHIESVPPNLYAFYEKCGKRAVAFNNRLKGEEGDKQVKELLTMIQKNVEQNKGECYKNEMYIEAEKLILKREAEIRKQAEMKRQKELQAIKEELTQEFLKESEKQKSKTAEEIEKWKKVYTKLQEEKRKEREEIAKRKCEQESAMARDYARGEVEEEKGFWHTLWDGAKSVVPGIFSKLFS